MNIENVSASVTAKTKQINTEIVSYFSKMQLYLQQKHIDLAAITSIDDYKSHFSLKDVALANLVQKLVSATAAKQVVDFGLGNPNFEYGQNSALIKEPCNCTLNPISVQDKKVVRAAAERFLKSWSKLAGQLLIGKDIDLRAAVPAKRIPLTGTRLTRKYLP